MKINRRKSKVIDLKGIKIGGDNPILVQSMTNTKTQNIVNTVKQINALQDVGADLVRVSCPQREDTLALKQIIQQVDMPIIADIHFHYKRAIEAAKAGAVCLRINPGNIGSTEKVKEVIKAAKDYNCAIRIGVNSGSLEDSLLQKYKEPTANAMVESAFNHIKILEDADFTNFKISVKSSDLFLAMNAYEMLANKCDYPLHLGITEAGGLQKGTVLSSIGIGSLLMKGIGDTIRVSLSADPKEEIKVGYEILKALKLRQKGINIISCPSCSRQGFDVISVVKQIEDKLEHIKSSISISILGCVVNGIGESKHTHIGVVGMGGTDEDSKHNHIYINGVRKYKVSNEELVEKIISLVESIEKKELAHGI